jgi:predicted metal-binding membrane protein
MAARGDEAGGGWRLGALWRGPMPALLAISLGGWGLLLAARPELGALCGAGEAWTGPGWTGLKLALAIDPPVRMVGPWLVMFVAMMPPLLAWPIARLWAEAPTRRLPAVARFALAYAGVWLVAGVALSIAALAAEAWAGAAAVPPLLIAGAIAVFWQATPAKGASLRLCSGDPGGAGAWRYGLVTALGCIGACWALMLVPLVAAGDLERWLMAVVAIALLIERQLAGARLRPGPSPALGAR